eukprot:gene32527-17241_t
MLTPFSPGLTQEKVEVDILLERLQKDDYRFHLRFDDPRFISDQMSESSFGINPASPSVVDNNMLGFWKLVYASNGTAVTRTEVARLLVAASKRLPSTGLFDVSQELSTDPGGAIRSSNTAVFGLGPLGSWRIGIEGSWRNTGDGRTAMIAFDSFKMRPIGWLGVKLPTWLPNLELGTGSSQSESRRKGAEWVTSFCDDELRVGKGKTSGNLFLFKKVYELKKQ